MHDKLIGVWRSKKNENIYGDVIIDFRNSGEMIYTVLENNSEQKIFLNYEITGDTIVTNQASFPKKEVTRFVLRDNELELTFNGLTSKYVKDIIEN